MTLKFIVLCAFGLLIQNTAAQRVGCGCSSSCQSIAVSNNGGPLAVTSIGPIVPNGIALATDLGLSGVLDIAGTLPYLSAVAFEGQYPTSGTTPVTYGCGDCVAINQQIGGNSASIPCGCRS